MRHAKAQHARAATGSKSRSGCGSASTLSSRLQQEAVEAGARRSGSDRPGGSRPRLTTNTDGTPGARRTRATRSRLPGPAQIGVPNFFIDKFRIPPFLLPIYQAAGMQYGIRWEVLAGDQRDRDRLRPQPERLLRRRAGLDAVHARHLEACTASTPTSDGEKDPFNPVDAIFAAARYLKAAGGDKDIRRAIFAYNHADWYVDSVLMRAQVDRRPARPTSSARSPA